MKTKLEISKLIEKAEQMVYDGKIQGASMASLPVQEITLYGIRYQLSINMTLMNTKEQNIVKNLNKAHVSGSCEIYTETQVKRAFMEGYKRVCELKNIKYNSLSEAAAKEQCDNWLTDHNFR